MNAPLTKRQQQILDFIRDFSRSHHRPPTFREIASAFKYRSINAVTDHLRALEHKGMLSRRPHHARGIQLAYSPFLTQIPVLGRIVAGQPLLSEENRESSFSFEDIPRADFALVVSGSSMINAGIFDGDTVFVKRQSTADHRDIVVAMMENGETTVKRLLKIKNRIILHPENDLMEDIPAEDEIKIVGKITGVLRKL